MNRRLYRSRTDAMWAGVAGGVAEWLNADPSLVRVAWVILTPLTGGLAALVYLVMWVVVPEAPATGAATAAAPGAGAATSDEPAAASAAAQAGAPTPVRRGEGRAAVVVGVVLVIAGAFFLAREFVPAFDWDRLWPAALVVVGLVLLFGSLRGRG